MSAEGGPTRAPSRALSHATASKPSAPAARAGVAGGRVIDIDPAGRVEAADGSWWLEWWIGADDRWHDPAREAATRQHRIDAMPVFETRVRVPGGDAVQHLYGVRLGRSAGGEGDHLVVEVLNQSRLPFALAVACGSARATGSLRVARGTLEIDGRIALRFPRAPSRWAGASSPAALFELVAAGAAQEVAEDSLDGPGVEGPPAGAVLTGTRLPAGPHGVALLWPLAHTAGLRLLVPLDLPPDRPPATVDPAPRQIPWPELPGAEQVARGWRRQLEAVGRVQLPDEALQSHLDAARGEAVLEVAALPDDPSASDPLQLARLVGALAAWGHAEEARAALGRLSRRAADDPAPIVQAAFLLAVASYRRNAGDPDVARAAAGEVARAADAVQRARGRGIRRRPAGRPGAASPAVLLEGLTAAAELLAAMGEPAAARALLRRVRGGLSQARSGSVPVEFGAVERRGRDIEDPIALLDDVHDLLVRSNATAEGDEPPEVSLVPGWREAWRGRPLEVHRLPGGIGVVSYAVRWHGEAPALLWDIEPSSPSASPPPPMPRLAAPALAPGWVAHSWRGEALLPPPR